MAQFIPCKNTMNREVETKLFFQRIRVHFGFPKSIILYKDSISLNKFWRVLRGMMILISIVLSFIHKLMDIQKW
jgi:hypothetical protein